MKKITQLLIFSILCMTGSGYAQNMVPNPSFELYDTCPYSSGQISFAYPWQGVTTNSSDYFNACGTGGTNAPNGGGGAFQYARTGSAYAGIWAYMGCYYYREYIQIQLVSVLVQDSCYLVEFYCNLNNLSSYGINKMAAAISSGPLNTTISGTGSTLVYTPQIISNQFIIDTLNWVRVFGYYKALGGEQYLTIGNFNSCTTTDTSMIDNGFTDSYYYIDDVKVEKISACDSTGTGVHEQGSKGCFKIYPNPNNGNMLLEYIISGNDNGLFEITDLRGKVMIHYDLPAGDNKLWMNNDVLESGMYIYHVIMNDKIVKSDKLLIIK
jgi:hypothetical protein